MSDTEIVIAARDVAVSASSTASDAADFAAAKAVEVNTAKVAAQTAKTDAETARTDAQAAAAAAGAQMWVGGEAVTTATVRQAPDGSRIRSNTARTTRATFDATEQGFWTPVLSTAGTMEQVALSTTIAAQVPDAVSAALADDPTIQDAALTAVQEAALIATPVTLVVNGDGTWTLNYGDVDITPPTPGTLAASAVTQSGMTLTVTGASDTLALHATPYAFSTDNGATWSAWQASASKTYTGLTASTTYTLRHKVRDAQGNETVGTAITQATAVGIAFDTAVAGTIADSTTVAVNLATATLGALALVFIERNNTAAPTVIPTGWTLLDAGTSTYRAAVYWKVLGSGDLTTHTWTFAGSSRTVSFAATYRNTTSVSAYTMIAPTATYSTSFPFGPLTTAKPWVVGMGGVNGAGVAVTFGAVAGYTTRWTGGNTTSQIYGLLFDSNAAHAGGSTNPSSTLSSTSQQRASFLIALS